MNEVMFGKKENFAIELGYTKTPDKYKLCFWVLGKKMGSFTKGGELRFSLAAYRKFVSHKDDYYLPELAKMTPAQIDQYLVRDLFALGRSSKKEKMEEHEKRSKLHLFFGPQFSNDGSNVILLYQNDNVIFVYTSPKGTASQHVVDYDDFCKVFEEYIKYCEEKQIV